MKIMFGGGLFGKEALCYQGREIVKQLAKQHTVKLDAPPVEGYWAQFCNTFEGDEEAYIMNGHPPLLPKIALKHKNIVHITVFETTLPTDWVNALNIPEVKEIWTVSEFCKKLILESGVNKPVNVSYLGVDERFYKKGINIFPKDKSFKFLNVSAPHCLGNRDRKGLDVLLRAFKEEFGDDPSVTLILRINPIYAELFNRKLGRQFNLKEYITSLVPKKNNLSNIAIITNYLDTEWLNNLYNSVDCGVFPTRAEGFGLPQAEMIKVGKPVITTDYGATNEFSDPKLRIKVERMMPLDYNFYPYNDGHFAEPSVESLRKLMRDIYDQRDVLHTLGEEHSQSVEKFTWDKVGDRLNEFLQKNELL